MSDLRADLDAFLADDEPVYFEDEEPREWDVPLDPDQANRMLRRMVWLKRELADVNQLADAEAQRLAAWREDRTSGALRQIESLERALEGFARAADKSTLNLPNGVLRLRPPRARVEITDGDAFRQWAADRYLRMELGVRVVQLCAGRALDWTPDPLFVVEVKPEKRAIVKLTAGPVASETDEEVWHRPLDDDEGVPGVVLVTRKAKTFTATPAAG